MLDGIQKYSSIKPAPITYADLIKQSYQIHLASTQCGKMQMGIHMTTHDLSLNQTVMYQEPMSKMWYPTKITRLCAEPRSYVITTEEGMQYRKT